MIILNAPEGKIGMEPCAPCQLYRHFDAAGRLLYVGISLSAVARLTRHRHDSHWFSQIATVTIETLPDRAVAEMAEEAAIRDENPLHNLHRRRRQLLDWDTGKLVAP